MQSQDKSGADSSLDKIASYIEMYSSYIDKPQVKYDLKELVINKVVNLSMMTFKQYIINQDVIELITNLEIDFQLLKDPYSPRVLRGQTKASYKTLVMYYGWKRCLNLLGNLLPDIQQVKEIEYLLFTLIGVLIRQQEPQLPGQPVLYDHQQVEFNQMCVHVQRCSTVATQRLENIKKELMKTFLPCVKQEHIDEEDEGMKETKKGLITNKRPLDPKAQSQLQQSLPQAQQPQLGQSAIEPKQQMIQCGNNSSNSCSTKRRSQIISSNDTQSNQEALQLFQSSFKGSNQVKQDILLASSSDRDDLLNQCDLLPDNNQNKSKSKTSRLVQHAQTALIYPKPDESASFYCHIVQVLDDKESESYYIEEILYNLFNAYRVLKVNDSFKKVDIEFLFPGCYKPHQTYKGPQYNTLALLPYYDTKTKVIYPRSNTQANDPLGMQDQALCTIKSRGNYNNIDNCQELLAFMNTVSQVSLFARDVSMVYYLSIMNGCSALDQYKLIQMGIINFQPGTLFKVTNKESNIAFTHLQLDKVKELLECGPNTIISEGIIEYLKKLQSSQEEFVIKITLKTPDEILKKEDNPLPTKRKVSFFHVKATREATANNEHVYSVLAQSHFNKNTVRLSDKLSYVLIDLFSGLTVGVKEASHVKAIDIMHIKKINFLERPKSQDVDKYAVYFEQLTRHKFTVEDKQLAKNNFWRDINQFVNLGYLWLKFASEQVLQMYIMVSYRHAKLQDALTAYRDCLMNMIAHSYDDKLDLENKLFVSFERVSLRSIYSSTSVEKIAYNDDRTYCFCRSIRLQESRSRFDYKAMEHFQQQYMYKIALDYLDDVMIMKHSRLHSKYEMKLFNDNITLRDLFHGKQMNESKVVTNDDDKTQALQQQLQQEATKQHFNVAAINDQNLSTIQQNSSGENTQDDSGKNTIQRDQMAFKATKSLEDIIKQLESTYAHFLQGFTGLNQIESLVNDLDQMDAQQAKQAKQVDSMKVQKWALAMYREIETMMLNAARIIKSSKTRPEMLGKIFHTKTLVANQFIQEANDFVCAIIHETECVKLYQTYKSYFVKLSQKSCESLDQLRQALQMQLVCRCSIRQVPSKRSSREAGLDDNPKLN